MDCKISKETKTLVERYLDAANNLYGIVPLSKILSIYNSQNDPLTEDSFLSIVDEVTKKHKYFIIVGEDEIYDDVIETKPIDREVVAEHIFAVDEDDYYYFKEKQSGKPYYVPGKEQFLKYEDEYYHEKTLSFISFRAFLRNIPAFTKEQADDLADDIYFMANICEGDIEDAVDFIQKFRRYIFSKSELEVFIELFSDMFNNTRLHIHRGFTPREMRNMYFGS